MPQPNLRIAFVAGVDSWWRTRRLALKYAKMRLDKVIYPDVFCLPYFLAPDFDFIQESDRVPLGKYDLILAELQGGLEQQRYLWSLISGGYPVAVVPGPPEILARDLTQDKILLVRAILRKAPHVWAYSSSVRDFCNGLIGERRAVLIPWPFDYTGTKRIAGDIRASGSEISLLLQVPLRFCGVTQNFPFVLKSILLDIFERLPTQFRRRVKFRTFSYTDEDSMEFGKRRFGQDWRIVLEPKKSYKSFVRLLAQCDAVINLTQGGILGRVTFLAAALGKPGIFSNNCDVNEALYPGSTVAPLDTVRLQDLAECLLQGLKQNSVDKRLLPRISVAAQLGDFAVNALRMRDIAAPLLSQAILASDFVEQQNSQVNV